jgi:hypothetical protein
MVASMAIELEIARLSKLLVDAEGISFEEAEQRLRSLRVEIIVGHETNSAAAHAAILTAVSVGQRTFLGGVRVSGVLAQPLITALPIKASILADAVVELGANGFEGLPSFRLLIGDAHVEAPAVSAYWDGWVGGVREIGSGSDRGAGDNPLSGIVAGAMAIGLAFDRLRAPDAALPADISVWGASNAPRFEEIFLPGAAWIVGLGNLGQALLWALAALPYAFPKEVDLVLQDDDLVDPENWGTSVLVKDGEYGMRKTYLAERWLEPTGFRVRRIDRRLLSDDRLHEGEPMLALAGLDSAAARSGLDNIGFEAIVDAGLGRTATDFDVFRVTVFHAGRSIADYFAGMADPAPVAIPDTAAYNALKAMDPCGAAKIAGASVAVPYVSAIAACIVVARAIALVSGIDFLPSTSRRTGGLAPRRDITLDRADVRALMHAGRPKT